MSLITPEQQKAERLRAMARVFESADRILTGKPITVSTTTDPHTKAPGYSTGDAIFLNLPYIGDVQTTDDIIKVTGLNFHELAHAEFTPRDNTWMVRRIKDSNAYKHFNMLEDMRIESMFTSMYPATVPYFIMTIMNYIAGDQSQWGSAYALTYGRRYLPKEVNKHLRDKYKAPQHLDELESLIDDYRVLVFPRDEKEGLRIVLRYRDLLKDLGWDHQPEDPYGHSTDTRPVMEKGEADEEAQDAGSQWVEYRDDEDDHDPGADEDDSDSDSGQGDGDEESDEDGEGSGDGDGEDGEGDDSVGTGKGDGDADESGDDGQGDTQGETDSKGGDADADENQSGGRADGDSDDSKPSVLDDKALEDLMRNVAQQAAQRPEVQADAKQKEASIKANAGSIPALDQYEYNASVCTPDYMFASNAFRKELAKMWVESDPGWKTHKPSGRVNVQRAMRGGDIDSVFDSWDEGKNDATSIEMVILFDFSSSMASMMRQASEALWAIKRAVESIGGEVTVIGFDSGAVTMYDKKTKADKTRFRLFGARGTTNPTRALDQARLILHYSKKVHRIVLFVTDGAWSNSDAADNTIKTFHAHGIMTALAFISHYDLSMYDDSMKKSLTHGVQSFEFVSSPSDLVGLAKQMVKKAMTAKV